MKNLFKKERPNEWLDKVQEVPIEKVPGKIGYEIVREKDARTIITKKGKLNKKRGYVDAKIEGVKRRFYANHILKETRGKKDRYFVRWNAYLSEAYDSTGKISYDSSLESQLMNDMESQLGKAVGAAVGFVLEKPMIYLLVIAFFVSIPIGFSYNNIFNWVPHTIIHWVPRT